MERISEISLEKNGSKIKMVSIIMVILILLNLPFFLCKIKFSSYKELKIIMAHDKLLLISSAMLNKDENVILENNYTIKLQLNYIEKDVYEADMRNLELADLNYLRSSAPISAKISSGDQNLFQMIFNK